jgi:predicted N-acetyltransferase YhbS
MRETKPLKLGNLAPLNQRPKLKRSRLVQGLLSDSIERAERKGSKRVDTAN